MRVHWRGPLDDPGVRAVLRALEEQGATLSLQHEGAADAAALPDDDRTWLAARAGAAPPGATAAGPADLRGAAPWAAPGGLRPVRPSRAAVVVAAASADADAAVPHARTWAAAAAGTDACLALAVGGDPAEVAPRLVTAGVDPEDLPDVVLVASPAADPARLAALVAGSDAVLAPPGTPAAEAARGLGRPCIAPGPAAAAALRALITVPGALAAARRDAETAARSADPAAVAAALRERLAERPGAGPPAPRGARPVGPARRPLVAITGDVTAATSLGALNRGLARGLLARGDVDVALVPEPAGTLAGDPPVRALLAAAPPPARTPDVWIANGHPPRFARAAGGVQVQWLHWEFGAPPREWIDAARLAADEVWVDTEHVRGGFLAAGLAAERVAVVHPGVDPELLHPGAPAADLGDAAPGYRFLFVGGLVHRKGADLLLDAWRRAFTADDDVTLVVKRVGAGGPYPRSDLDALAEAMAADPAGPRVRILDGPVTDADVAALYAACDCLVHPYRGEAFGMTMLEAMACGLPVVAPDRGAARAFMDHRTAVLVPAEHRLLGVAVDGDGRVLSGRPEVHEVAVGDLAAALRGLAADPARGRRVGARAARRVRRDWTWEAGAGTAAARIAGLARSGARA